MIYKLKHLFIFENNLDISVRCVCVCISVCGANDTRNEIVWSFGKVVWFVCAVCKWSVALSGIGVDGNACTTYIVYERI